MDFEIRELKQSEYPLLEEFLYQAIYVPEDCSDLRRRNFVEN